MQLFKKLIYALSAVSVLTGCGPRDYSESFTAVTKDSVYEYLDGAAHYRFNIDLLEPLSDCRFADSINADVAEWLFRKPGLSVNDAMYEYIEEKIDAFRLDNDENRRYSLEEGYEPHFFDYEAVIDATLATGCRRGVIGVDYVVYEYLGGAHGSTLVTCRNYSRKDGHLLGLDDVFRTGYQDTLLAVLENRLLEKTGCTERRQLDEVGYFSDAEMFIPDNFRLKRDSVVFIFNQYDIAPYSTGITELAVAYRELPRKFVSSSVLD